MKFKLDQLLVDYTGKAQKKVKKYAKEDKTWYYVEVILTLFTISFFAIFAIRPAVVTISGLVGEINRKKELSQKMQQKINSVIVAQEQYSVVQKNWKLLASYLPSAFNLPQGIAQIAGSAQEKNLNINSLSLDNLDFIKQDVMAKTQPETLKAMGNKNLEALSFSFNSISDLEVLKEYISQLKKSRRWTQIDNYQLSKSGSEEDEEEKGRLNLTISGYWLFWVGN